MATEVLIHVLYVEILCMLLYFDVATFAQSRI